MVENTWKLFTNRISIIHVENLFRNYRLQHKIYINLLFWTFWGIFRALYEGVERVNIKSFWVKLVLIHSLRWDLTLICKELIRSTHYVNFFENFVFWATPQWARCNQKRTRIDFTSNLFEFWYKIVFGVTDFEFDAKKCKFYMADPIDWTKLQHLFIFVWNLVQGVFRVTNFKFDITNYKCNITDPIWRLKLLIFIYFSKT